MTMKIAVNMYSITREASPGKHFELLWHKPAVCGGQTRRSSNLVWPD